MRPPTPCSSGQHLYPHPADVEWSAPDLRYPRPLCALHLGELLAEAIAGTEGVEFVVGARGFGRLVTVRPLEKGGR